VKRMDEKSYDATIRIVNEKCGEVFNCQGVTGILGFNREAGSCGTLH